MQHSWKRWKQMTSHLEHALTFIHYSCCIVAIRFILFSFLKFSFFAWRLFRVSTFKSTMSVDFWCREKCRRLERRTDGQWINEERLCNVDVNIVWTYTYVQAKSNTIFELQAYVPPLVYPCGNTPAQASCLSRKGQYFDLWRRTSASNRDRAYSVWVPSRSYISNSIRI